MASKFPEVITSIAAAVLEIVQKNLFWDQIRREIGIELPLHIKILLHFNGYESAASIKNVSDSLFTELEEFAKEELYTFMDSNDFKPDFYGIYYNNISKFRILSGYRHSIKEIQNYIKEKSLLHFCPNEVDKVNREVDRKSQEKLLGATSKQAEKISVARTKTSTNDSLLLFHETALYNIIKKFYLAVDNSKTLFTTFFNGSKRQFVQVFIKEDTAGGYGAKLKCCLCSKIIPAGLYEYKINKFRWVYRNFTNHVKTHLKDQELQLISQSHTSTAYVNNDKVSADALPDTVQILVKKEKCNR